jgi:hypothetical protein
MGKPVAHRLLFRRAEGKQNQVTRVDQVLALISLLVLLIATYLILRRSTVLRDPALTAVGCSLEQWM